MTAGVPAPLNAAAWPRSAGEAACRCRRGG